jgi:t-SNARE complex subunit (syntaxin)
MILHNQTLTKMSTSRHQELHREMNEYLRQQTDLDGNHMRPQRGNSGEKIRGIFSRPQRINALKGFYDSHPLKYWDARYKFYHNNHIRYFPW